MATAKRNWKNYAPVEIVIANPVQASITAELNGKFAAGWAAGDFRVWRKESGGGFVLQDAANYNIALNGDLPAIPVLTSALFASGDIWQIDSGNLSGQRQTDFNTATSALDVAGINEQYERDLAFAAVQAHHRALTAAGDIEVPTTEAINELIEAALESQRDLTEPQKEVVRDIVRGFSYQTAPQVAGAIQAAIAAIQRQKTIWATNFVYWIGNKGQVPSALTRTDIATVQLGGANTATLDITDAKAQEGWGNIRPRNYLANRDYYRQEIITKATDQTDSSPVLVFGGVVKIDHADASETGLDESEVEAVVERELDAAGLSAAQRTAVLALIDSSGGGQTEAEVRQQIATAISGIAHIDSTARAEAARAIREIAGVKATAEAAINSAAVEDGGSTGKQMRFGRGGNHADILAELPANSSGGAGTISGVSGWGENLFGSRGNLTAGSRTIDLSGEIDEVAFEVGATTTTGRRFVLAKPPFSSVLSAYGVRLQGSGGGGGGGGGGSNSALTWSITGAGANASVRIDDRPGNTAVMSGVYKKTRITGVPPTTPEVPAAVEADVGKVFTVIRKSAGVFVGAWRAAAAAGGGVMQAALDAVKTELQGQISLLSEAVFSEGQSQPRSPVLTELANRGTITPHQTATWKQNREGERSYPHTLDLLLAKGWPGEDLITGGNTNLFHQDGNAAAAMLHPPAAVFRKYYHDPDDGGNPWPGQATFYSGERIYATGLNAPSAENNGNLVIAFAYERKQLALPSADNLMHQILWSRKLDGVEIPLLGFHNRRLVMRVANESGATQERSYSQQVGLTDNQNEANPLATGIINIPIPADLPANTDIVITAHANVEGVDAGDPAQSFRIIAVAGSKGPQTLNFAFNGLQSASLSAHYYSSTRNLQLTLGNGWVQNNVSNFHLSFHYVKTTTYRQATTFSEYQLLAGDGRQNGIFVEGADSTVRAGGEVEAMLEFVPKFDDEPWNSEMQMSCYARINGVLQNNGNKIDINMRLSELFPNGWHLYAGNAVGDDYIYYNRLTAVRYHAHAQPTAGEFGLMHAGQRGGDAGLGAYAKRSGIDEGDFELQMVGRDSGGNKVGMVRYKELLESVLDDVSPNLNANRRLLDADGIIAVVITAAFTDPIGNISQDWSRTIAKADFGNTTSQHFIGYSATYNAAVSLPLINGKRYIRFDARGHTLMAITSVQAQISTAAE